MKKFWPYVFVLGLFVQVNILYAQSTDTLPDLKLFSKKSLDITASTTPVQQIDKAELSRLSAVSVADAVKFFSGVIVKDYGGIGGLKTVSVRSLGANHTAVMYDGIIVSDAQGGQIDLGRFSLDNIALVQLFNNQPANILLPARSYSSAAVIALSSYSGDKNILPGISLSARFKAGSFGFINPSVHIQSGTGKKFHHAVNAEYQYANGDYPFADYETGKIKKKRSNSDIKTYHIKYDAAWEFNDSNRIKFKAYYYNSKRGLPGAVILYNNFSNERLNNQSFFSQLSSQKAFSPKSRILFSAKYSTDSKYYLDPSYQNNYGKLENKFQQQELYLSVAYSYKIAPSLSAGYAFDYFRNKLKRTDMFAASFANPARDNYLNNIAVQWKRNVYEINANLLSTYFTGKVERGPAANDLHKITPAISAALKPFHILPLRLRVSYKNIFRAPTFDDLYYTNIGNTNLRPEYAKQYNFGVTINKMFQKGLKEITFTSDAYYNNITDQILAVPRQNLFQWTMLNIGKVHTKGIDNSLHLQFMPYKKLAVSTSFSYTFQQAQNVSDPLSPLYKTQLAYTPQHSGSMNLDILYGRFNVSYNMLASSYRYRLGQPGPENLVKGWLTHDISASYARSQKNNVDYRFIAEANNVSDLQYEIIKYYPMPRFNYRLGIIINLKLKP